MNSHNLDPGNSTYKELVDNQEYDQIEKIFWQNVENSEGERIKVEYAADLPNNKFGRSLGKDEEWYKNHPWHLNKMHLMKNSLLQFCKEKYISGITLSWIYVGMLFSSFGWHYEDIMMYSINYMHEGAGKIWYAIPEYHREKFERLAKEKLALLYEEDPNFLLNINAMINPAYLVENGVHVYRTVQKPGEIILTFPESYHQGVSVGFNIAEAVNVALPSWLEYSYKAMGVYLATREKVPVFPIDWLLIENARHIKELDFELEHIQKLLKFYQFWLQRELTERSLIASNYKDKEAYSRDNLRMLEDRDNVEEDTYEGYYGVNLGYASFVRCLNGSRNYCIGHELLCGGELDRIRIVFRYSNDELNQFLENIKEKIAQVAL